MKKAILIFLGLVLIQPFGFAQQFNTNFNSFGFSAELDDPFIGRKQELYSVIDSQNRTHVTWVRDNENSRVIMYSIIDGNLVSHFTVDSDSIVNMEKKHPVLVLDNNEKPHIVWFVRRYPSASCCPSGNFAVMYAGDSDGDGVFTKSQVSTNPENPTDNTVTEYTDSYVNNMPSIMITESGSVEVAYISDTYSTISYDSYLVIARKNVDGNSWQYEEALVLDDITIYQQDGVLFPPRVSDTYYGLIRDISPDDIELVTNASGSWTKTSLTNDPSYDIEHPQILTDSQGSYHIFYFYYNRDINKKIVKHLSLTGTSISTTETFELNEMTNVNYVYAAIDQTTDDIYLAYTGFNGGYNEYLVYFEEGLKKEIFLKETGVTMGYHTLNANNGFVSFVTADESKDSIYVITNSDAVNTVEFDGKYNGSVTQDGIHIGTFTFEVTGSTLSGSYDGDNESFPFDGNVDGQGNFEISISNQGSTITVNGAISSNNISGSWGSSSGDSGTIFGSSSTTLFDGDYSGSAFVGNSAIGDFVLSIINGLIKGKYTEEEDITPINGYIDTEGDISFNIIFEDESITTIKATIENGEISGTFSNTLEGSGTISGSKSGSVSIEDESNITRSYYLAQNYPNPFNPSTDISFDIPESSNVTLEVFDMLGRQVSTLINEQRGAGNHTVNFQASSLSSGIYIYRIRAGNFIETKRMTLIK